MSHALDIFEPLDDASLFVREVQIEGVDGSEIGWEFVDKFDRVMEHDESQKSGSMMIIDNCFYEVGRAIGSSCSL